MTVVRKFQPEVRLKKLLSESGGVSATEAIERATAGLDSIREQCLVATDGKIDGLMALASSSDPARIDKMYRTSNEIFAEAGAFGLVELSAAAHSLCGLLGAREAGPPPQAAIVVHIEAMRALRKPELAGDLAARVAVLTGLRGLAARYKHGPS
jgi:hypothetical protein